MAYVDFTTTGHRHPRRPRPVWAAETELRVGVALAANGVRGLAIERLTAAYRAARHSMLVNRTVR